MRQANIVALLDRLHEIATDAGRTVCGQQVSLDLGGAFYPDDGDGGRNLLSVAEGKLEAFHQRWEESLRALILAGGPSVPVEGSLSDMDSHDLVRQDVMRDNM